MRVKALKCLPITKNGSRLINIVWLPMPVMPKKVIRRKDNGTTKKARNPEYAVSTVAKAIAKVGHVRRTSLK